MEISGELHQLKGYQNWAKGRFMSSDHQLISVVGGPLLGLQEGGKYLLSGTWTTHPKYGTQFQVHVALPDLAGNRVALEKYLRKRFKGCGQKTATQITQWFADNGKLDELRRTLMERPWDLLSSEAVAGKRLTYIEEEGSTLEARIYRRYSIMLGGVLSDAVIRRLGEYMKPQVERNSVVSGVSMPPSEAAWAKLAEDPFLPIMHISGYGFRMADKVAKIVGIAADHPTRLAAIAHYAVQQACDAEGHLYLTRDEFKSRVHLIDPAVRSRACVEAALNAGFPVIIEDGRIYTKPLYWAEKRAGESFAELCEHSEPLFSGSNQKLEQEIRDAEKCLGYDLDESQQKAIRSILTSKCRLHTLTAGPGCGKTSIMEILARVVRGLQPVFAAPTGKAARVLTSRIQVHGFVASTIHKLLEPAPQTGAFQRNAENPINSQCFIIDEASMVDLELMNSLLAAVPFGAHVILIGDTDQLPSVGAGQVLDDVLKVPADHNRLNVVHRNRGKILESVIAARNGRFYMEQGPDYVLMGAPGNPLDAFERVAQEYVQAIRESGHERVALLMPRRRGQADEPRWNTTYANAKLQNLMNPDGKKIEGTTYREGDRIILRRNMVLKVPRVLLSRGLTDAAQDAKVSLGDPLPDAASGSGTGAAKDELPDEPVVNGDTGLILGPVIELGQITGLHLRLDDGREVILPISGLETMGLAYALTVHAAQGSQYDKVIVVLDGGGYEGFLHRKIIYTALSRARQKLIVFSSPKVASLIVSRHAPSRNSMVGPKALEHLREKLQAA